MTCMCIDRKFRNVDFVLIVFKEGVIIDHYHFQGKYLFKSYLLCIGEFDTYFDVFGVYLMLI